MRFLQPTVRPFPSDVSIFFIKFFKGFGGSLGAKLPFNVVKKSYLEYNK